MKRMKAPHRKKRQSVAQLEQEIAKEHALGEKEDTVKLSDLEKQLQRAAKRAAIRAVVTRKPTQRKLSRKISPAKETDAGLMDMVDENGEPFFG